MLFPFHDLHGARRFLEQLLIPCLAGPKHQGKLQLSLNTLKKIIAVPFSFSHFWFDFHIIKKYPQGTAKKKKIPCQQKYCSFLEKSTAPKSGRQPQVISSLSQHRQSSITPTTPPCHGLAPKHCQSTAWTGRGTSIIQHPDCNELGFFLRSPGNSCRGEDSWSTDRHTLSAFGEGFCEPREFLQ